MHANTLTLRASCTLAAPGPRPGDPSDPAADRRHANMKRKAVELSNSLKLSATYPETGKVRLDSAYATVGDIDLNSGGGPVLQQSAHHAATAVHALRAEMGDRIRSWCADADVDADTLWTEVDAAVRSHIGLLVVGAIRLCSLADPALLELDSTLVPALKRAFEARDAA